MNLFKKVLGSMFVFGLLLIGPNMVSAAQNADLRSQLQGPSSSAISTPVVYTASVKNNGPSTAVNVKLMVTLPLTNTSPTVHILGNISGLDSKCQIVLNKISCNLGDIRNNKTVSINYTYKAPVSTKLLTMTSIVSSDTQDNNASNNQALLTPNLTYPDRNITSATINNSHCTGQNLTSYCECLLYPSSIASHSITLNVGGGISFSEPGYTGTWSQSTSKQLHFEYFDGSGKIAEFNGFAINGQNCFDGMTTFFPASPYISPYRACIQ